jgi:hypothetical protein
MAALRRLAETRIAAAAALLKQQRLDLAIEVTVVVNDFGDLKVLADVDAARDREPAENRCRRHATDEEPHARDTGELPAQTPDNSSPFRPNADSCRGFLRSGSGCSALR